MRRQRGAAILTAMLLVALVATLSAAALWQQWRAIEVESAERAGAQARWLMRGAADWARLILREDARNAPTDHLGEPWAVPLQEAQLSSFLGKQDTGLDAALQDAYLSGQILDLQARLNVLNLVQDGRVHAPTLQAFARLFEALQLPPAELPVLVAQLQSALALPEAQANAIPGNHPLLPRSAAQLGWLGLSPRSVARLQPYVTLLPERTPVNLNTAPAAVLQASIAGLDAAHAQRMVQARTQNHFRGLADAIQAADVTGLPLNDGMHSVGSRYFEVRVRLRLGPVLRQESTVMRREGLLVKALWNTRETPQEPSVQ